MLAQVLHFTCSGLTRATKRGVAIDRRQVPDRRSCLRPPHYAPHSRVAVRGAPGRGSHRGDRSADRHAGVWCTGDGVPGRGSTGDRPAAGASPSG